MPISAYTVEWQPGELAKMVDVGRIPHFLVNEYERCLFIRDGKIYQEFGAGRHVTSNMPLVGSSQFAYVRLRPFEFKWGLPETFSKDNVRIGCFGSMELAISDPKLFYTQVLAGKPMYNTQMLRAQLMDNIQGVIRSELSNLDVKQIYVERDVLISVVRAKLQELFGVRGIDYKRLEIQGVNVPDNIKEALESLKLQEISMMKKKSEMSVEMERMKMAQEMGIDALKLKEMEILEKSPDILGKKYEKESYQQAMQASRTSNVNVGITGQQPQMSPDQQMWQQQMMMQQQQRQQMATRQWQQQPMQAAPQPAAPAAAPAGDDIGTKLNKLKGLFEQGLISEQEYAQKKQELMSNF